MAQRTRTTAHLESGEAGVAAETVFAWVLVPAANRLIREVAGGGDARRAAADLRDAVHVLDRLGWPADPDHPADLTRAEADLVRHAARSCRYAGLDGDSSVHRRFARGPATPASRPRRPAVEHLLGALDGGAPPR